MSPVHPQWIDVQLVGGPDDGHHLMVHKNRQLIMSGEVPDHDQLDNTPCHAYFPRGDFRHFDYVGKRSRNELKDLVNSGQLEYRGPGADDCDEGEDWKK